MCVVRGKICRKTTDKVPGDPYTYDLIMSYFNAVGKSGWHLQLNNMTK